jgi:hypothetical protein
VANPYHHAVSSAKKWGGEAEDYLPIHRWFDESKELHGDFRHRALRHHAHGIFECERVFGVTIELTIAPGRPRKRIPTRWVAEQHVREDHGFIPTLQDWLVRIEPAPWMNRSRPLSRELDAEAAGAISAQDAARS